jgi:hypothetical protein
LEKRGHAFGLGVNMNTCNHKHKITKGTKYLKIRKQTLVVLGFEFVVALQVEVLPLDLHP